MILPAKYNTRGDNQTTGTTLTWWIAPSQWRPRHWPRYYTESRTRTNRRP